MQRGVGEENQALRGVVMFVGALLFLPAPFFSCLAQAPAKAAGHYLQRRDSQSQMNHQMFHQATGFSQSWNNV